MTRTAPHTLLRPEDRQRYRELTARRAKELEELRLQDAEATFRQLHRIGKFHPYFLHHPKEPAIPIYPTIPSDVAHLIRISLAVESALRV